MRERFSSSERMIEINPSPLKRQTLPRYHIKLILNELTKSNDTFGNIKTETIANITARTKDKKEAIEFFEKVRKDFK
jgi:hypothetical protein